VPSCAKPTIIGCGRFEGLDGCRDQQMDGAFASTAILRPSTSLIRRYSESVGSGSGILDSFDSGSGSLKRWMTGTSFSSGRGSMRSLCPLAFRAQCPRPGTGISSFRQTLASMTSETHISSPISALVLAIRHDKAPRVSTYQPFSPLISGNPSALPIGQSLNDIKTSGTENSVRF
jgi:hypothetical protein